eukprot:1674906-Amphidinium_carterae.1
MEGFAALGQRLALLKVLWVDEAEVVDPKDTVSHVRPALLAAGSPVACQEARDALAQRLCVVDPPLKILATKLARRGNRGRHSRRVAAAQQGDGDLELKDIATFGLITKLEMGKDIEGVY